MVLRFFAIFRIFATIRIFATFCNFCDLYLSLVTSANAESLRKRIEYLAEASKAECDKLKFDLVSIRDRSLINAESLKKTETVLPDIRSGLGERVEYVSFIRYITRYNHRALELLTHDKSS